MDIYIGSDHAGYNLKKELMAYYTDIRFRDMGCDSEESVHYPEFAHKVAEKVNDSDGWGILICYTGIGMSMVANRYPNVRASLCSVPSEAKLTRQHNDSNILCLGARDMGYKDRKYFSNVIDVWLETEFEGGRHQTRINLFNR